MKALKCDICGIYFDENNYKDETNDFEFAVVFNKNRDYYFKYLKADICPDCLAAIKKTIDDRRKKGIDPMKEES